MGIALFFSVVFGSPYFAAALAVALSLRFRAWEVVAAGLLMDLLWMPSVAFTTEGAIPYATAIALLLVIGLEPLRRQLLVDSK
jgi:hypothetical protein